MRAFSIRRRNQLPPNIFIRLWRRWMAAQADQLLEAARLGSDKVEYLTHGQEMSNTDRSRVTGRHLDDLLRRRMLALDLDPYELALSDPALLRHLEGRCARCESRHECASGLARGSTNEPWQGGDWCAYCENAQALEMLIALRSRSRAAPKYQFPFIP
jgi:hypothetical protein